ncbi:MAG: hypothetical protein DRH37_03540 [Deltaproteobacteria bacterium]|nr:MAG: hypothetical protein DRH37_03540 [Deltaproteobacteria bacterium]
MRFLLYILIGYLLYRLIRGLIVPARNSGKDERRGTIDEMVQDPCCKTYIPLRNARKKIINGKEYFFCSDACYEKFITDRGKGER